MSSKVVLTKEQKVLQSEALILSDHVDMANECLEYLQQLLAEHPRNEPRIKFVYTVLATIIPSTMICQNRLET
ncbi:hypothetical protein GALMADRAFT_141610 [Galerina marginata CBS 339.88]|uniref:Uncharacterized protein n=1 Tax=Galerina marginata (strain CBS 339.88) TaxID=685588 RepID=A0A067T469_GALM3|nr:hypothetical protein GALMADRAFT_141610 [Galerina marginata CBS 339.88]